MCNYAQNGVQESYHDGRSLIVVHSFGVWIVRICCILFELCLKEKKERKKERKEEEEEEEKEEEQNQKFSCLIVSTMRRGNGMLGLDFI